MVHRSTLLGVLSITGCPSDGQAPMTYRGPLTCETVTWYGDADGDGYGVDAFVQEACDGQEGWSSVAGDCDDTDAGVHPEADEECDGIDQDCDGIVDEDASGSLRLYADDDGDGYGRTEDRILACAEQSGWVEAYDDCDDADAAIHPGATELWYDGVDQDCDGWSDLDADQDGYESQDHGGDDCDDADETVYPRNWYPDDDGDGYGVAGETSWGCPAPDGYVATPNDCDDGDPAVYPGAPEICGNGLDDDCSGTPVGCELSGRLSTDVTNARLDGSAAGEQLGMALAVGDVDADGLDDLLVGAPGAGAWLHRGPLSGSVGTTDAWLLEAATSSDESGTAVALDDLDGDGIIDVLVGAPGGDTEAVGGLTYVVFGPLSGDRSLSEVEVDLSSETTGEVLGSVVGALGDQDGDGWQEVLAGAPGTLFVSGAPGAVRVVARGGHGEEVTITGAGEEDRFGAVALSLGDLDGDGIDELGVGAPADDSAGTNAGRFYIFSGPVTADALAADAGCILSGERGGALGKAALATGDLDGDGSPDLVVGSPESDTTDTAAGEAWVIRSSCSGSTTPGALGGVARLDGAHSQNRFGSSFAGALDFTEDGEPDLWVGGGDHNLSISQYRGVAYLFAGPFSGTRDVDAAEAWVVGDDYGDELGRALAVSRSLLEGPSPAVAVAVPDESDLLGLAGAVLLYQGGEGE